MTLGGARGFNTTILTVGTRDVQGAVRSPVLLHLRSRPPGLADSQHRVSVTNPLSFSLDWCHSVMAQKSSVFCFFLFFFHFNGAQALATEEMSQLQLCDNMKCLLYLTAVLREMAGVLGN